MSIDVVATPVVMAIVQMRRFPGPEGEPTVVLKLDRHHLPGLENAADAVRHVEDDGELVPTDQFVPSRGAAVAAVQVSQGGGFTPGLSSGQQEVRAQDGTLNIKKNTVKSICEFVA